MDQPVKTLKLSAHMLTGIKIFQCLSSTEREIVAQRCKRCFYLENQTIVAYQAQSQDVYFILSGRVQVLNYSLSGHQIALQELAEGEMFGELSAIDGAPRTANVIAATDASVISLSAQDFFELQRLYPAIRDALIRRLTGMVRRLCVKVFEQSVLPSRQRVRVELLRMALERNQSQNSATISPAPTHAYIAAQAATSRETVTREMTNLRKIGVIGRRRGALVVSDIQKLTGLVEDAPRAGEFTINC